MTARPFLRLLLWLGWVKSSGDADADADALDYGYVSIQVWCWIQP